VRLILQGEVQTKSKYYKQTYLLYMIHTAEKGRRKKQEDIKLAKDFKNSQIKKQNL